MKTLLEMLIAMTAGALAGALMFEHWPTALVLAFFGVACFGLLTLIRGIEAKRRPHPVFTDWRKGPTK